MCVAVLIPVGVFFFDDPRSAAGILKIGLVLDNQGLMVAGERKTSQSAHLLSIRFNSTPVVWKMKIGA